MISTVPRPHSPPQEVTAVPSPLPRTRRLDAWLAGVLVLAAVVRLSLVGAQSAWVDEGYSMALARHDLGTVVSFTALYDAHPPLYYAVLHLWQLLAGPGIVQGRLLSVVCGVGAVGALYVLTRALCGRATALCAALLLALSPVSVWFSVETRMYAMAGFLALTAVAFLVEAARRERWGPWLGYVACAVAALYTDYSSAYLLVAAAVAVLATARSRALLTRWVSAQAAAVLLVLPLCVMFFRQLQETSKIDWIPAPTPAIVTGVVGDLLSQYGASGLAVALFGGGLVVLGGVVLALEARQAAARGHMVVLGAITLAPLVLPLSLSSIHPVFLLQSVVTAAFGLLIIVARGVTALAHRLRWAVLLLLPLLVLNLAGLHTIQATTINEDWRSSAQYVHSHLSPGDTIIFDPRFLQLPFDLYWAGYGVAAVERGYPLDETLATQHPLSLSTPAELARATAGARTVWLITRNDIKTTPSANDAAVAWLLTHESLASQGTFQNVRVYRFTTRVK